KSPQYQRLIHHFSRMALFAHVITPIKDIQKVSKNKVTKQYGEVGEELKMMNIRHELGKVMNTAFKEDTFFGYVHRDRRSFYIQQLDARMCKITAVEDGVY